MRVLGLSSYYHDSAAALVEDGRVVAAAQEERFSRKKHDAAFPGRAIVACLDQAGIGLDGVDFVAFYDKPFLKFERLLETYVGFAPRGFASFARSMPVWMREKLFLKDELARELTALAPGIDWGQRLLFTEHHHSHAASAFYPSPFDRALVLTVDGAGEWATTSMAIGEGNRLTFERELHFPHSLGLLYSAFTYYLGFKVNSGEYKVMGLAPYGEPVYAQKILDTLMDLKPDGTFRLNMDYFDYCIGSTMTNRRFDALFGGPPRRSGDEPLTRRHMDLAASVQSVTETVMLGLTRSLARETGMKALCLAGGVALNCVANGRILRDGHFDELWIQPAAGDSGGAVGAALAAWHGFLDQPRHPLPGDGMAGGFLGPSYTQSQIEARLSAVGARYRVAPEAEMIAHTAEALAEGRAVGWFQGRMEFGPRALGNRSILADPRSPGMQKHLNLKIKFRESFRPFAPSVLAEEASRWFDLDRPSPYMLLVADVAAAQRLAVASEADRLTGFDRLTLPRSTIPAATHVDGTARVQTVHRETNPRYHALISAFKELTGCPVLVNTSFNVRGEPIVATPEDAFRCFMATGLDLLVVGDCLLAKADQDPALAAEGSRLFEPD